MHLFGFYGWRYGDNKKIRVNVNPRFVSSVTCEELDPIDPLKQEWRVLMSDGAVYKVSVGRETSFDDFVQNLELYGNEGRSQ